MTPAEAAIAEEQPILEVRDLDVSHDGRPILRGVNLVLQPRETVVILGRSGCGKSTLLRALLGSVPFERGEVIFDGAPLTSLRGEQLDRHRKRIGVVFQSGALFESMTVGENIACVLREHTSLTEEEVDIVVRMKLEMVGLRHAATLRPAQISGGMRKRVAVARALALNPDLMLYDEPGSGLDPVTLAGVDHLIGTLARVLRMSSLIVTHNVRSGFQLAHRVVFLHEGRVLAEGSPGELAANPRPELQRFLTGSRHDGPDQGACDDYARALLGGGPR